MEDNTLVESSFSSTINAPIEKVDISGLALYAGHRYSQFLHFNHLR